MTAPHDTSHRTEQRRFLPPWWTVCFPLAVTIGVAGWQAATGDGSKVPAFLAGLLWPGLGAFAVVAIIVWLGWVLDID